MADLQALIAAVEAGDRAGAVRETSQAITDGVEPRAILDAMVEAMAEVGRRFQRNEAYVPEMLISARAMKEATALLTPILAGAGVRPAWTAVIGTIHGDLHDLGKNLVGMMWRGADIGVIDLGTNVEPTRFAEAARQHNADLVGISALLTTTMVGMRDAVAALRSSGPPDVKVIVGGAPVTAEFAGQIGADGYAPDAASAVDVAKQLLGAARPATAVS